LNPPHRIPRAERWLQLAPPAVQSTSPAQALSDEALIAAVVDRDVRAAGELHDRLISVVHSTLYRILGRREQDHEDLVQATFEQVVLTLVRGRFARGCRLSTWASTVAAHVAFNALRARRRAGRVFDAGGQPEAADRPAGGDPEREACVRQEIRVVQGHLAEMKSERAVVLLLHDVVGHELAEIAAMLQISLAAAQSRLFRGRRELLARLDAASKSQKEGGVP
jgi:RNA polymerase sigma-70 factor (ECF subfamily)